MSAVPLLFYRTPFFACPHIWAAGTVATLLSNIALLAVVVHLAGDDVAAEALAAFPAFAVLGACAGAEALGFLLVWANMVPRYRPTLWRWRTKSQHAELTHWEGCTDDTWGSTRNDARAFLLELFANRYWPREALVKAWLREEWAAIRASPWFLDERGEPWRAHFPPGWLPVGDGGDGGERATAD